MNGEPRAPILFVGVLPPPVNGMTIASAAVVAYLRQRCDLRTIVISHRRYHRGLAWRLLRGAMYLRAAARLARSTPRPGEKLYLVANSRGGLVYDRLLTRIARRRGWDVVLHHQVYSYLHRHDSRMAAIDQMMGATGTHVCLCPKMIDRFRELYGSSARFIHLPNTVAVNPPVDESPAGGRDGIVTLGHISNLTLAKGLNEVLETHRALRQSGRSVRLILAGPCATAKERKLIDAACREAGDAVRYLGPVYDDAKWAFFRGIDVMLFPTRYLSEAQPLVVAEALMCGVPVIAYDRACIAGLVGETGGWCVPAEDDFVAAATKQIARFIDDPATLTAMRQKAWMRGRELRQDADAKLRAFGDALMGQREAISP